MSPPDKLKTYARSLQFTSIASATIYGISAIQKLPTPLMCWRYHKVFNYRICRERLSSAALESDGGSGQSVGCSALGLFTPNELFFSADRRGFAPDQMNDQSLDNSFLVLDADISAPVACALESFS